MSCRWVTQDTSDVLPSVKLSVVPSLLLFFIHLKSEFCPLPSLYFFNSQFSISIITPKSAVYYLCLEIESALRLTLFYMPSFHGSTCPPINICWMDLFIWLKQHNSYSVVCWEPQEGGHNVYSSSLVSSCLVPHIYTFPQRLGYFTFSYIPQLLVMLVSEENEFFFFLVQQDRNSGLY